MLCGHNREKRVENELVCIHLDRLIRSWFFEFTGSINIRGDLEFFSRIEVDLLEEVVAEISLDTEVLESSIPHGCYHCCSQISVVCQ